MLTEENLHKEISAYYEENDLSYQNWGGPGPYHLHYGYQDDVKKDHHTSLLRMVEVLAELAGVRQGETILDAGCGVGGTTFWLAERYLVDIHGISISPFQIRKAKEFARANGNRIGFSAQDFCNTSFPENSFDLVWAVESVCHAYHKEEFIQEVHRVLKPGGRLMVADFFLNQEEITEVQRYSLDIWLRGWAIPNLAPTSLFLRSLKEIGFKRVNSLNLTENIRASSNEIYRRGKDGYPDDLVKKGKNIKQIEHVQAGIFQKVALDLGVWSYRVFTGFK